MTHGPIAAVALLTLLAGCNLGGGGGTDVTPPLPAGPFDPGRVTLGAASAFLK